MKRDSPPAAATPRYLVVAQALMHDIERGRFKVGAMLPTELEICKKYRVSRYTAREAVRRLTDAGLVSRRAGIGTTIKARTVRSRYTASVSDLTELLAFNRQTRLEILTEDWVKVAGELTQVLAGAQSPRWFRFTALRYVANFPDPIVYTEILVHPRYEAIRDRIREPGVMVHQLIEELHGERIAELRQEIGCIAAPKRIAALLGTRTGSPALRVLRYYLGKNEALYSVAINTYPHDRFKLATRWHLDFRPGRG